VFPPNYFLSKNFERNLQPAIVFQYTFFIIDFPYLLQFRKEPLWSWQIQPVLRHSRDHFIIMESIC